MPILIPALPIAPRSNPVPSAIRPCLFSDPTLFHRKMGRPAKKCGFRRKSFPIGGDFGKTATIAMKTRATRLPFATGILPRDAANRPAGSAVLADHFQKGAHTFPNGARTFANGAHTFFNGADTFSDGVDTFFNGADTFFNGVRPFCDGADTFFNGARPFANGVRTFAGGVGPFSPASTGIFGGLDLSRSLNL